ncbi:MAG: ABC transporter substrate-binding protein [Rhodomicrobium sp.]
MSWRFILVVDALFLLVLPMAAGAGPDSERGNMLRGLASQAGRVLGAASACPSIAQPRVKALADKITEVIKNSAPSLDESNAVVEQLNQSIANGARSIAAKQNNCTAAGRQLAGLENASAPDTQSSAYVFQAAGAEGKAPPDPVRGVTGSEIVFGMAAPFSGPARELGLQMRLGIETAFRSANDDGGTNGRMLRLVSVDDGYEPVRTAEAVKQLYEKDRVLGFIGNVGTPTAMVSAPFALEHRMLFFGAFTGAGILRRDPPDRYVFNYRASYAEETDAVVQYLVNRRKLAPDQIAVFAQQDSFGDAGFAGVAKAMRALRGGDGSDTLRIGYPRNTIDVDAAIAQLKANKKPIKAIVMVATYRAAARFIEKTRDTYPGLIYTNVSFVGSTSLRDELMLLGPKYAAGIIVTQTVPPLNSYSTLVLQYRAALAQYFGGEAPDYVSLEGYIAAQVLIEALRRAGPQLDTEKTVDALESMNSLDIGIGARISFSRSEHQAIHKVWGTVLDEAGKYQPLDLQ